MEVKMPKEKEKKYKMKEKKYLGKLDLNGYHIIQLERPNEIIEIKVSIREKKED